MQIIYLIKFGAILISRPDGKEAFNAIRSTLNNSKSIQVNFEGVLVVTSGWFDEFLTNLADYFSGQVQLIPTENASVRAILPVLAMDRHDAAAKPLQQALFTMQLT